MRGLFTLRGRMVEVNMNRRSENLNTTMKSEMDERQDHIRRTKL